MYATLLDAERQLWMSTNRGLFRIGLDDAAGVFTWYNYKDLGLPWPAEFNTGCFAQYGDRVLLFRSRDGVAEIRLAAGGHSVGPLDRHFTIWKDAGSAGAGVNIKGLKPAPGPERLEQGFSVARYYFIPDGFADDGSPAVRVWSERRDTAVLTGGAPYELLENRFDPTVLEFTQYWRLSYDNGRGALAGQVFFREKTWLTLSLIGSLLLLLVYVRRIIHSKRRALEQEQEKNRLQALNFRREQEKKEQENRQIKLLTLLHETGSKLTEATRIADIQDIFNGPGFDLLLEQTLNSDQIALALYHPGSGTLQIEAYYAGEERRGQSEKVTYWLEESLRYAPEHDWPELAAQVAVDRNRPIVAVWEWANGKTEANMPENPDELVNNYAEFFSQYGRVRQTPKIGALSDSFIFQVIRVEGRPVGILTVQQRARAAYAWQPETGRYREADYLKVLRHYVALAISRIQKTLEQRLSELQAEMQRHALQHRFSSHFIGNTLDEAKRLTGFAHEPTEYLDRLAEFYKKLFILIDKSTELREELALVQIYYQSIHNRFNHNIGKPAIRIEQHPEILPGEFAQLRIPSFSLLNTIHNSVEHNKLTGDLPEITVRVDLEVRTVAGAPMLTISVRDNGPGNHPNPPKSSPGRIGFTRQLRRYFDGLNETHRLASPEVCFAMRTQRLDEGRGFQAVMQINCNYV